MLATKALPAEGPFRIRALLSRRGGTRPRAASVTLMLVKFLFIPAALLVVACSSDEPVDAAHCPADGVRVSGIVPTGDEADDRALFLPASVRVTPRPGINSVFNVAALTLRPSAGGADVYAAVRNEGDILACNASFSVELHDEDDQVIGASISGLMTRGFYRFTDGSGTIAGCVAPGEVTMVAIRDLTLYAPLEDVQSAVYQSNYWGDLKLAPTDGVSLADVKPLKDGDGVRYTGELVNGLDTDLRDPTVAVFSLNAVGRPLGVAYGASSVSLAPCAKWEFQTGAVSEPQAGVAFDAYPMGGP